MGNTWRITELNNSVAATSAFRTGRKQCVTSFRTGRKQCVTSFRTGRKQCVTSFLLLRWHCSSVWTFASLIDFSQSALFFFSLPLYAICNFSFINIRLYTVPPSVFSSSSQSNSLMTVVKYLTYFVTFSLLTWRIQFNRLILTNESISKSPNSCINSLLYRFLQFSFTLITRNFHLTIF